MANSLAVKFCLLTILTINLIADEIWANRAARIIGGEIAEPKRFPSTVFLKYDGIYVCGGALISRKHVLSAAHCVCGLIDDLENLAIVSGTTKTNENGETHAIKRAVCHPDYKFGFEHSWKFDVAVLTLNETITVNETQSPIALPTRDADSGEPAVITGWGKTDIHGEKSKDLKTLNVTVMSNSDCQSLYKNTVYPSQICAIGKNDTGAYGSDSGSPLYSKGAVVGIFSWTMKGYTGYPGVYTRVYSVLDFIKREMEKE